MTAPEGGPARALGSALRDIRGSLPSAPGTVVSQTEVARLVLVGGKGAVSLYENGKRIPSAAVVRHYCDLARIDPSALLALRDQAVSEARAVPAEPQPAPPQPEPPTRSGTRRTILVAGCCAALGVGAGAVVTRLWAGDAGRSSLVSHESVVVDSPHGETARVATVSGTVRGLTASDLWVDVQSLDETGHHLMDHPCDREHGRFTMDDVAVGGPGDHGRLFRLSVLAVPQGSSAEMTLVHLGARSRRTSAGRAGTRRLPEGAGVVAEIVLRRR